MLFINRKFLIARFALILALPGGMMDLASGLIYVGNGQYYNPSTGRFLTRGVNPNGTNPYVPWGMNPIGAIIGPLSLFSLIAIRKRGKPSKGQPYLFLFVMLVVLPLSIGMACNGRGPTEVTAVITPDGTATITFGDTTVTANVTPSPGAPSTPVAVPCPTPTNIPLPTPGFDDNVIIFSSGWSETQRVIVMEAILAVGEDLAPFLDGMASTSAFLQAYKVTSNTPFTFLKMEDAGSGCATGQRLIKCNPNYNISDPRLIVHELGHALQHSRYNDNSTGPYGDLKKPENAIIDDRGAWVTGQHPEPPQSDGKFERTFLGYKSNQIPDVYHGVEYDDWNSPNEDFADMFMNWVYNSSAILNMGLPFMPQIAENRLSNAAWA